MVSFESTELERLGVYEKTKVEEPDSILSNSSVLPFVIKVVLRAIDGSLLKVSHAMRLVIDLLIESSLEAERRPQ